MPSETVVKFIKNYCAGVLTIAKRKNYVLPIIQPSVESGTHEGWEEYKTVWHVGEKLADFLIQNPSEEDKKRTLIYTPDGELYSYEHVRTLNNGKEVFEWLSL